MCKWTTLKYNKSNRSIQVVKCGWTCLLSVSFIANSAQTSASGAENQPELVLPIIKSMLNFGDTTVEDSQRHQKK